MQFAQELQGAAAHVSLPEPYFERLAAESLKLPASVWKSAPSLTQRRNSSLIPPVAEADRQCVVQTVSYEPPGGLAQARAAEAPVTRTNALPTSVWSLCTRGWLLCRHQAEGPVAVARNDHVTSISDRKQRRRGGGRNLRPATSGQARCFTPRCSPKQLTSSLAAARRRRWGRAPAIGNPPCSLAASKVSRIFRTTSLRG
jgi:hypothetical protein